MVPFGVGTWVKLDAEEGSGCLWGGIRSRGGVRRSLAEKTEDRSLLRRLCCQKAESPQLVVGENDLLASVAHFQVADASQTRKAPDFCPREAQEDGGVLLLDSLLLDI